MNPDHYKEQLGAASAELLQRIDQLFIGFIEELEGRVPSNAEMTERGARVRIQSKEIEPGFEFFVWRNDAGVHVLAWRVDYEPSNLSLKWKHLEEPAWPGPLRKFIGGMAT